MSRTGYDAALVRGTDRLEKFQYDGTAAGLVAAVKQNEPRAGWKGVSVCYYTEFDAVQHIGGCWRSAKCDDVIGSLVLRPVPDLPKISPLKVSA